MLASMDLPVFDSLVREIGSDRLFDILWDYKLTGVMDPSVKDPEGLKRDLGLLWSCEGDYKSDEVLH